MKRNSIDLMQRDIAAAIRQVQTRTAWRLDGTLREFPKFPAVNVWFDYPIHRSDTLGTLKDIDPDETWQKNFTKRKTNEDRKQERKGSIETAFSAVADDGRATVGDLANYLGVTEKTVRNRLKEHGGFWVDESECGLKQQSS